MIIEVLFIFVLLYLYFLVYIAHKININNEIYKFDKEETRSNINSETNLKLPFHLNVEHIFKRPSNINSLKLIKKTNGCSIYRNINKRYSLFEPYIKHNCDSTLLRIKSHSEVHVNQNKSTFYFFHNNNTIIHLIHPSYIDHILDENVIKQDKKTIEYIKNNDEFIHFSPSKNDIIHVPNYWYVLIENTEQGSSNNKQIVEKMTYNTLIDDLISLKEKYLMKK